MKAYLINLDRNAERLTKATEQLKAADIQFERFLAVDGRAMDDASLKKATSYFRWWCCSGLAPSKGEIGCALSHLGVYRKMLANGEKAACVFEDDVVIKSPKDVAGRLEECEKALPRDKPTLILLSNFRNQTQGQGLVEVTGGSFAEAYVLNDLAAKLILKANTPVNVPADAWGRWHRFYGLKIFQSLPAICTQDWHVGFKSDVTDGRIVPKKLGIWWYCKRLYGKIIDRFLILIGK